MARRIHRRRALKELSAAGAGLVLARGATALQESGLVVGSRPVEIAVTSLGPSTVRLTLHPIEGGEAVPATDDSALVAAAVSGETTRHRDGSRLGPLRAGELSIRFTEKPPVLHIETLSGKLLQRLTLDEAGHDVSFLLPEGPLLGMGEGGPQFDRKGSIDAMINGQRGYQLRTHGGRVPIQWLVGTDGWDLYIHQPLGTFDFTGREGRMRVAPGEVAPLDVFFVISDDPKKIVAEFARLTGYAEMPARWTFGYQQSHRTLAGPEEILSVAQTLRDKKLPCDTLIYLGTEFTPSDLETTPLYVRAGAVLPHDPVRQHTSEAVSEPTTLVVYPGADGRARLYEDDGVSFDYRRGEWMGVELVWRDADRRLALDLTPGSRLFPPQPRPFHVRVAGSRDPRSVTFRGAPVEVGL